MAVPTILAGTLQALASGTTLDVTLPSHQADDILVVTGMSNVANTITLPTSGWAAIIAGENNAAMSTAWFWKRAASGAETTPQLNFTAAGSTTDGHYGLAYRVRGCTTTETPFEDATLAGILNDVTPDSSAIDTLGPERLAVCFWVLDDNNTVSSYPPATWTDVTNQTSGTGGDTTQGAFSKNIEAAGNVASVNFTQSAIDNWKTLTLAFLPAAAAAPLLVALSSPGFHRPGGIR